MEEEEQQKQKQMQVQQQQQQQQQRQQEGESTNADETRQAESDEDDDETTTIEFEIEIVSNNSVSKPGSLNDLRELDDCVAADEPLPSAPPEQQLESTSPPSIVDLVAANEAEEETDEVESPAVNVDDSQAIIADLAVIDGSVEIELGVVPSENQELKNCGEELERIIPNVDQEPTCAEQPGSQTDELIQCDQSEKLVNQEEAEEEDLPVNEEEMKLEEINLVNEEPQNNIAQIKNDDLRKFTEDESPIVDNVPAAAVAEAVVETTISYEPPPNAIDEHQQQQQQQLDWRPSVEQHMLPIAAVNSRERATAVAAEPVGFRNIREIYKVLNSDSVLIVGCRPELIGSVDKQQTIVEEEPDWPVEITVEQVATVDVLGGDGDDAFPSSSERPTTPQSPEITIEHSALDEVAGNDHEEPFISATTVPELGSQLRRCSATDSEDLEWEFDNEPAFERRDVKVKRGQNPRDEYELGGELGRGKFGTVFRCTHRESGKKLAAKFVLTRRKEDREDVEREVEIMSQLQHKRLLQLHDAFDNGTNEMCLVTELVEGGELFERIVDDDFDLTEKKAAIFMRQICEGVDYMHSRNIVHLDMKPENILCISRTGNRIKLIDFGLARRLDPNETLRVMFGTPDFAAPEVLCYDTVSFATDMWSVGVICYVLLSGLSPFMGNNDMETMANVTRATYDFDEDAFDVISDLAKDFISKLLVRDQTQRLKPNECLKHAWLAKGGHQLEVAVQERRKSIVIESQLAAGATDVGAITEEQLERLHALASSITVSLDKRNLKKYVVRRKWHKTVHAIMALGRMGAKLKSLI